jgi:RNA polymerase sigma-70 factor (ECF subfamily)
MTRASDQALAAACAAGSAEAVAAIEAAHFDGLRFALRRMRLEPHQIDDVLQDLRTDLFVPRDGRPARIGEYQGRSNLRSWLRVCATRLALKHLRRARGSSFAADDDALLEERAPADDPELACIKDSCRDEFRTAFQQALSSLDERERAVLRLHAVDGLGIDEIGAVYQVHRATAARWIASAENTLLDRTRRTLMSRGRIGRADCESMLRLVQSQLAATIRRRLAAAT